MSNLAEAEKRRESSYAITLATCQRAASTGFSPDQVIGASQYGGSSMLDSSSRERAVNSRDLLGHFRGEVYTSIRPIMERLAGRPIRVARVKARGQKKQRGKVPSHFLQKWFAKSSLLAGGAEPREVEILDQHPLLDALESPAPSIVGWSNWHLKNVSVASLCVTGYAYWWFPVVGGKTEIWYLPPDWVWPLNEAGKLNVAWEIQPPHCEKYQVPREQICPFWFPDPANPLRGLGPVEAGIRGVLVSEFLEEAQKRTYQQGINPTAIVTLGGTQTRDGKNVKPRLKQWQMNQIRDQFNQRYADVWNSGKVIFIDAAIESVDPWGNKPSEMSYGENAQTVRDRVRRICGTSDYATGEGSLGSRAESAESDYHFCENNLNPKCELISRTLTLCVLPVFDDDPSLIAFIEPPEPHDHERKAQAYDLAVKTGIIPINDYLVEVLGKEPVPYGDNFMVPSAYTVRTPEQMQEGFAAAPAAGAAPGGLLPAPQQPTTPTGHEETPEDEESAVAEGEEPGTRRALKKNIERDRKQFVETWLKTHGEREETLTAAMLALQTEQADAVAEKLKEHFSADVTAEKLAAKIFEPASWVSPLKDVARKPLTYAWVSGASQELEQHGEAASALPAPADAAANQKGQKDADLGFDFGVDLPDDVTTGISAALEKSLAQPYWAWIEETKQNDLIAFLEQALDDGKPLAEIVKDVRAVFDGAVGQDRALTIARTEVTGALNGGAFEAQKHLEDEGVVEGKEWMDTADSRTRETHLDAGGQTVGVREKFIVGGYPCDYPGDASLPAKERVRCRCATSSSTGFGDRSFAVSAKRCDGHEGKSAWPYAGRFGG